jgi:hypothetical protein
MQNSEFGISHHLMDNQQKKEHLMKSGISAAKALGTSQRKLTSSAAKMDRRQGRNPEE